MFPFDCVLELHAPILAAASWVSPPPSSLPSFQAAVPAAAAAAAHAANPAAAPWLPLLPLLLLPPFPFAAALTCPARPPRRQFRGDGGRGHSGFKEGTPTSPLPRRIIGTPCSSSYCRRLPLQIPALRTGLHRQNKSVRISRAPRATQLDLEWARSRAQLTFFF